MDPNEVVYIDGIAVQLWHWRDWAIGVKTTPLNFEGKTQLDFVVHLSAEGYSPQVELGLRTPGGRPWGSISIEKFLQQTLHSSIRRVVFR